MNYFIVVTMIMQCIMYINPGQTHLVLEGTVV